MSNRTAVVILACLFGVGLGVATARRADRSAKWSVLQPQIEAERHTSKISGPLAATIQSLEPINDQPGSLVTLEAIVTATENLQNVSVTWVLPPTLELVSGGLKQTLIALDPDQPARLTLIAKTKSAGNQQVHLLVAGSKMGMRFSTSAQFNSIAPKHEFLTKQDLLKRGAEPSASESEQKVFH